jgi:hypothetical protein
MFKSKRSGPAAGPAGGSATAGSNGQGALR